MDERKSIVETLGGKRRVILLVMGFAVASGFYHWQSTGSVQAMRRLASELGLEVSNEGQRWQLRGRIDDIGVNVQTTTENLAGDTRWFTDFKLYAPNQPSGRIIAASLRQKAIGGLQDVDWLATGDADFDEAVLVHGDPAEMLLHLDDAARAPVRAAAEAGWQLDGVTWSARESGRLTSANKMRALLDLGLAAARAMDKAGPAAAPLPDAPVDAMAAPVTPANALEVLAEVNTPRSLEAALLLGRAGDTRQEVRNRLASAIYAGDRVAEVVALLGDIGGQLEIVVLNSVTGEHEEAAKAAIAAIQQRL
jgi:hypothetical protein